MSNTYNVPYVPYDVYMDALRDLAEHKAALDIANKRIREAKDVIQSLKEQLKQEQETQKLLRVDIRAYESVMVNSDRKTVHKEATVVIEDCDDREDSDM